MEIISTKTNSEKNLINKKYKKIFVTGGAGFIGSHVVDLLIKEGYHVAVYDNLSTGKKENVNPQAKFIEGDVLDYGNLYKSMNNYNAVIHEAGRVSIWNSVENFDEDAKTNIIGGLNVLKSTINNNLEKIIHISSMAAYGSGGVLKEEQELKPISPYGISKATTENYFFNLANIHNLDLIVLRYFNTYGPRQTNSSYVGVMTIFINNILQNKPLTIYGDGKQKRDFIYVKDVAKATVLALEKDIKNQVINVGSGQTIDINSLANIIQKKLNTSVEISYKPIRAGEPKTAIADISKLKKLLGFFPKTKLEDKLGEIIEWNKKQN